MNFALKLLAIALIPFFYGCAVNPQTNVNISDDFWIDNNTKIGVYIDEIPEVKGHIFGAGCLLCLATASAINSGLNTHMKTQSTEDLDTLRLSLAKKLSDKGMEVTLVEENIDLAKLPKNSVKGVNVSKKNFKPIGNKYEINQLLVLDIHLLGSIRNFSGYVPVGDPFATFRATMYIVDTKTNTFRFYESIVIDKYSETPWKDEGFPGMTNAYYTALELGKEKVLDYYAEPTLEKQAK